MFGADLGKARQALSALDADELLDALGLMRKRGPAGWLGPVLGGLACGLACGLLLAPRLREGLGAGGRAASGGGRGKVPATPAGSPASTQGRSATGV